MCRWIGGKQFSLTPKTSEKTRTSILGEQSNLWVPYFDGRTPHANGKRSCKSGKAAAATTQLVRYAIG